MDREAKIWDKKAQRFPKFTLEPDSSSVKLYKKLKEKGISFQNKTVLDIGCGCGRYALLFAKEGARVDALDVSTEMLKQLSFSASEHGIEGVDTVCVSFDEFLGSGKKYDMVFASMTPAVSEKKHIEYIHNGAKERIFIGWGRKRENPLMKEAFELHGLEHKVPSVGAIKTEMFLKELDILYEAEYFDEEWSFDGSVDDAREDISWHITINEATPNLELIDEVLERYTVDGRVSHTTKVEVGLIIW